MSAMGYLSVPLLDDATTGTSGSVPCHGFPNVAINIEGSGTISAGTLVIEEAWFNAAQANTYSGTWSQIESSIDLTAVSGGEQQIVHLPSPNAYANVRVRLTATVTGGGSVSVSLEAC